MEIIRMVLNVELFVKEVLYFLCFSWLVLTKHLKQLLLLLFAELRGPTGPEVRRE